MNITITPERDGPDYTGRVKVVVKVSDRVADHVQIMLISLNTARHAFAQLGQALHLIDANTDPS